MVELILDASNSNLSIALIENDNIISENNILCSRNLSEILLQEIDNILRKESYKVGDIDKIVVTKGPGSYTALRVVLSIAKTLAFTLNIDMSLISSLRLQAAKYLKETGLIVPIIDGRRGNIFTAVYRNNEELLKEGYYSFNEVITFLNDYEENIIFVGIDSGKFSYGELTNDYKLKLENILSKNIIYVRNFEEYTDSYSATPSYLRLTEAERNLNDDKNK